MAKGSPEHKLRHLHLAAANLDAAGCKDLAAKCRSDAQKLHGKAGHRGGPSVGGDHGMHRLVSEVRKLRRDVDELRKKVAELDDDDDDE